MNELLGAMRATGCDDIKDVHLATLELNGQITVVHAEDPTGKKPRVYRISRGLRRKGRAQRLRRLGAHHGTHAIHPCEAALARLPERLLVARIRRGRFGGAAGRAGARRAASRSCCISTTAGGRKAWRKPQAVRALARDIRTRKSSVGKSRATQRTEAAARAARYAFFAQAAKKSRLADLVLAHHADDQVETFLLQLLRGAGSGARGMEPLRRARRTCPASSVAGAVEKGDHCLRPRAAPERGVRTRAMPTRGIAATWCVDGCFPTCAKSPAPTTPQKLWRRRRSRARRATGSTPCARAGRRPRRADGRRTAGRTARAAAPHHPALAAGARRLPMSRSPMSRRCAACWKIASRRRSISAAAALPAAARAGFSSSRLHQDNRIARGGVPATYVNGLILPPPPACSGNSSFSPPRRSSPPAAIRA